MLAARPSPHKYCSTHHKQDAAMITIQACQWPVCCEHKKRRQHKLLPATYKATCVLPNTGGGRCRVFSSWTSIIKQLLVSGWSTQPKNMPQVKLDTCLEASTVTCVSTACPLHGSHPDTFLPVNSLACMLRHGRVYGRAGNDQRLQPMLPCQEHHKQ